MNLVTGGTGLVGAHLIYHLLEEGEKVLATYRDKSSLDICRQVFSYCETPELFKKIEWIQGDILDIGFLEEAMTDVQNVYHCAAIVSFDPSKRDHLMEVNITGTANVVNTALKEGIEKLCHISSIGAFGRAKRNEMVSEKTQWENDFKPSSYSISKFHGEMEVWRGIQEGLKAVIVNPSTVIGSGNWHRGSAAIIDRVWKGLPYYTNGRNGYVDVLDVVRCMMLLMKKDINGERFLLVGENWDYKDFLGTIARELGKNPPGIKVGKSLAEIALLLEKIKAPFSSDAPMITRETVNIALDRQNYSNEKVRKFLNYDFNPLDETIKRVCQNYLKTFNPA